MTWVLTFRCPHPPWAVNIWYPHHVTTWGGQRQSRFTWSNSKLKHGDMDVCLFVHDDVIKWKHLPRYWPFVRGIHWSTMNSPKKCQWRWALVFSLICAWINGWLSNRESGDLRRHRAHCDVIVMFTFHEELCFTGFITCNHDDVITWKRISLYWPFVMGNHRWPMDSPHKVPLARGFPCCRSDKHLNEWRSCWWFETPWRPYDVIVMLALQWRHNERDGVSNHQCFDCLLNCLFRRRSKKTSKLRVIGLCEGNSTVAGEFPVQMASNAENISIWWRHHANGTCNAVSLSCNVI